MISDGVSFVNDAPPVDVEMVRIAMEGVDGWRQSRGFDINEPDSAIEMISELGNCSFEEASEVYEKLGSFGFGILGAATLVGLATGLYIGRILDHQEEV